MYNNEHLSDENNIIRSEKKFVLSSFEKNLFLKINSGWIILILVHTSATVLELNLLSNHIVDLLKERKKKMNLVVRYFE